MNTYFNILFNANVVDGLGVRGRSTEFGETIRDWFRVLKERIVGKWNEWLGRDYSIPNLSPQDILTVDKNDENRESGYPWLPGLFLDLCK